MKEETHIIKLEKERRRLYTRINNSCGVVTAILQTPFYYNELYQPIEFAMIIEGELEDEID